MSSTSTLLEGPLLRAFLRVAIPAAGFQLLIFLNNFVDYQWVQKLGPEAAAGMTAGWTLFWMLLSIGQVFATGVTAVVARRVGEQDEAAALHAASHGMRGALLASLGVGAAGWVLVPWAGFDLSPAASAYAVDYLRTAYAGAPFIFWFYSTQGVFKGRGDMQRPLRAVAMSLALNMVLDPVLIHVAGLEVLGAALATVASFAITAALLCRAAVRRDWIRPRAPGLDWELVRRVVRIGTPISIHGIVFSGVYVVIVKEVNHAGGDAAGAALGLGLRIEGFAFMTGVGCATGAAAVVGQNLGARNVYRAHRGAWTAARVAICVTGFWGFLMLLAPRGVVELLSPGPVTTAYALDYLRIVSMSLAFTAMEIVLEGAFSGAGDTLPPMLLGIPLTLVRVPAAMAATAAGWGVAGVFWTLSITAVVRGLVFAHWFARGNWVRAKA